MQCLLTKNILILLCAFFSVSCGFIDLRPVVLTVDPNNSGTLLPEPYTPVILKFDTEMVKSDAEGLLQISSNAGVTSGDRYWKGNSLFFVPLSGWIPGTQYNLSLSGSIRSIDGRELRVDRFISFYAINKSDPPILISYSPPEGASIKTSSLIMEFQFSSPMDKVSVESALTIEGVGNKSFEWSDDDKVLRVASEKTLSPWVLYRWTLKDSAKNIQGVPLLKTYSAYFITDKDQILPKVERVFPVIYSEGCWFSTGMDIETDLGSGQSIAVEFNKIMSDNVLRSLRFEPSLTGRAEILSEKSIVYILSRDPEPGIVYTLIVSGDTMDSEGLRIGGDYRIAFIPDIILLDINSILILVGKDNITEYQFISGSLFKVPIEPAAGLLNFTINFSQCFNEEEKKNTALRIMLSPFFPKSIPPIALQYVNWVSGDQLNMTWE